MSLDSFSTSRLRAERLTAAHLPEVRSLHRNEQVMATLGGVRDEAETVAYLDRNLAHWAEHGFGMWILRDPPTALVIGRAGLRHLDVEGVGEVEVGYALFPEFWGRGLATEMACACVGIGRDRLGLRSVVAVTLPTNGTAQRVMLKAGLLYEREITLAGLPLVLFRTTARGAQAADERLGRA